MSKYFRVTAYHPEHDISAVFDSNGKHKEVWQLSSEVVKKGFKIKAVSGENAFDFGDMPRVEENKEKILLRACSKGLPNLDGNKITVNGLIYTTK